MVLSAILDKLITEVVGHTFEAAKTSLKKTGSHLNVIRQDFESSLAHHMKWVDNWSYEVSFKDIKRPKRISSVYIGLDMYVYPRRNRMVDEEKIDKLPLTSLFEYGNKHVILLGQPGAGKTTSMKYLCHNIIHTEDFLSNYVNFPVVIRMRDLNSKYTSEATSILYDQLANVFGLHVNFPHSVLKLRNENFASYVRVKNKILCKMLTTVLDDMKVLIILDGYDELIHNELKELIISELSELCMSLEHSRVILTSRTGDYNYNISNTEVYEICSLSSEQIKAFSQKWFLCDQTASRFLEDVQHSPYKDTTIRPLTLAHLCAIYERVGQIPKKPRTLYRKIVTLLLEDWDEQRSVRRRSIYADFELDRKIEFLSTLAYELSIRYKMPTFSKEQLSEVYLNICNSFGLKRSEMNLVVTELETHTGLFLRTGFEMYEFAHKSIQEFLSAEYIVRLPKVPDDLTLLEKIPNEMAVATSISSDSSLYLSEILKLINRKIHSRRYELFLNIYFNRLIIEKPDFRKNPDILLGLFFAFSTVIKSASQDTYIGRSSFTVQFIENMDALVKEILITNKPSFLGNIYFWDKSGDILDQIISVPKTVEYLNINGTQILRYNLNKEAASKCMLLRNNTSTTYWLSDLPDEIFILSSWKSRKQFTAKN